MKKHKHNFLGLGLRVLYLLNHIINIYSVYYNIVVVRKKLSSFPTKRRISVRARYAAILRSRWTVCWPRGQSSSTIHCFTATWVNCWASVSTGHFCVWQRSSEHWRRRLTTSFCISGASPTFSLTVPRLSNTTILKISPGKN